MSCVVAVTNGKKVWMGCDAMSVTDGYFLMELKPPAKMFKRGKFLIGFVGSFRMGQLLQFRLKIPPRRIKDVYRYMCTSFTDAVRECFGDYKWGGTDVKDRAEGGVFIVGHAGRVFRIVPDYAVVESVDDFMCCGQGEDFATGVLAVTENLKPKERVELSLEVASKYCNSVGGAIHILEVKS